MEYTLDIYARQPERLMEMMAKNCKDRRLETINRNKNRIKGR